jgi:stage V sporulation protein SpoVS
MAININAKTSGAGGLETTADNTGNINIQSGGSTVMSVTSSGVAITGALSQNGGAYSTQPTFRNLIINGDMRIDQRNAGASVSVSSSTPYTLDRWKAFNNGGAVFLVQQNLNSITPPEGFTNYLGVSVTTSDTPSGTETHVIRQQIEGNNISHLNWGTANAKTITISFWVRSSLTGTFGGTLKNGPDATYPYTYTIDSANTWEYKTITITGATSNTWNTDNSTGIFAQWSLGSGSSVLGTPGAWNYSANLNGATGETVVVGTSGATFYITGVQLEVGTTATDFENLPYDVELARCQRYYQTISKMAGYSGPTTSGIQCSVAYPIPMRATPTMSQSSVFRFDDAAAGFTQSSTGFILGSTNNTGTLINFTNITVNGTFRPHGKANTATLNLDAEL